MIVVKKSYACQGSDLEMVCNKGELIHILEATYGGASETVCAHNYSPKRTCVPMDIAKKLISRCTFIYLFSINKDQFISWWRTVVNWFFQCQINVFPRKSESLNQCIK